MARVAHAPAAPGVGRKAGSRWLRRRSPGWRRPGWCPWYQLSAQGERTRQQGDLTCTATTFTKAWSHHGETAAVPPPHYARACREVTSAGNGAWRLQRCPKQEVGSGCSIQCRVYTTPHTFTHPGGWLVLWPRDALAWGGVPAPGDPHLRTQPQVHVRQGRGSLNAMLQPVFPLFSWTCKNMCAPPLSHQVSIGAAAAQHPRKQAHTLQDSTYVSHEWMIEHAAVYNMLHMRPVLHCQPSPVGLMRESIRWQGCLAAGMPSGVVCQAQES